MAPEATVELPIVAPQQRRVQGFEALPRVQRLDRVRAAFVTMRPRQWTKNALVVAAAGSAGAFGQDHVWLRVGLAFIAFCLIASGIYAINDVRDAEEDRLHPTKRHRPVAAGTLDARAAVMLGAALVLTGTGISLLVRPLLALVAGCYIALTLSYTLVWRRVVVLDLLAIAGGFVLRAVAGGVAAPVPISRWFLVVVIAAAILVAAGKRHAELGRSLLRREPRRQVLDIYSERVLKAILAGAAVLGLAAYCAWAFKLPAVDGVPWRPMTIAPFVLCLTRYLALVRAGKGEAPESMLLSDRLLALVGAAWLLLFCLSVAAS